MKQKRSKVLAAITCDCLFSTREYLGGTAWNENLDLYLCREHRTIDLFNKHTELKYNTENTYEGKIIGDIKRS